MVWKEGDVLTVGQGALRYSQLSYVQQNTFGQMVVEVCLGEIDFGRRWLMESMVITEELVFNLYSNKTFLSVRNNFLPLICYKVGVGRWDGHRVHLLHDSLCAQKPLKEVSQLFKWGQIKMIQWQSAKPTSRVGVSDSIFRRSLQEWELESIGASPGWSVVCWFKWE